ncbi:hypothetical protein Lalb_Chr02g0160441 [Lupinus albus]|uniref:Reverse transcriptase zinc-binding domain-containing protein n=1 Tax=Lupinus albus TaxID=3870 RepID=A0A6A4R477_LUPAL|nr:hypothetical protein Lalb_Chr02g0160441 [Lupinus albus]
MGMVELVKSVIHSMLAYSFHIYAWPASLIKALDGCIRNFIWSGDTKTRKIVTTAWKSLCTPIKDGGLGHRSIKLLNQAAILRLSWVMISSDQEWAVFCWQRFSNGRTPSTRYFKSAIWHVIKANWNMVMHNSLWLMGDGTKVNFWKDNWIGDALVDLLNIPLSLQSALVAKVSDFVLNTLWTIPRVIAEAYPNVVEDIIQIHTSSRHDKLVWQGTSDGSLSLKAAFDYIKHVEAERG